MKLLCMVTLLVCAYAQGASSNDKILLPDHVEKHLENTHVEVTLEAKDNAVTDDDLLLLSELEALEQETGRNLVTDAIANALEGFRDVIINGNDDVPVLDPFEVELIGPFDYTNVGVRAEAQINNLKVEGLRWFVLDNISFNAIRLAFGIRLTIPRITVTGSYETRARVGFLNHRAGGNFRIFAHRIELGMDMRVGTNLFGGHLVLRQLDINIDIHDTHIQIHGMTGSSLLNSGINALVQNISQDVIQSQMENVSKMLSEELFDAINDILKDYTINDILGRQLN